MMVLARGAQRVDLDVPHALEQEAHCRRSAKYLKEAIKLENRVCFHLWGKLVDTKSKGRISASHFMFLLSYSICMCSLLGMGNGNVEKNMLKPRDEDPLLDSDDERPESFDDELRRKEMRRGIDLATTLERIEKNFVITDPRLPDNPIVCSRS